MGVLKSLSIWMTDFSSPQKPQTAIKETGWQDFNGATNAALKKEIVGGPGIRPPFASEDAIVLIQFNPSTKVNNVKAIHD